MLGRYTTGPCAGVMLPYGIPLVKVEKKARSAIILQMGTYPIPAREERNETTVANSRFIASVAPAFSVDEARQFISRIKHEFADATHNVPAFVIGHGASTITHCSDDGEPSGTAGRPALAVLSGSGLGDVVVVVTRYFGGTKLGTGGLVRAYSDAVRQVLAFLPRARKVPTYRLMIVAPYSWYERLRFLVEAHTGQIVDQEFAADVTLTITLAVERFPNFSSALKETSHGSLEALTIDTCEAILPLD
jgi:uncharacterized YigZ family protein